ncbi:hypothetical protein TBLA_0D01280 [Henningerozyma blattae CBS 6284]|uniref:Vacuolar membrane protein n=1 Tax=Henningerozyma blattae (strain ATCC 34711 / CBS 6284 / DSM 70876 / NBRC 10599 / NRRL Y-10934 / UCD 77-7) TaxID=1071380 RepID=I2H2N4_HENB6|nr:hypothetical protein TBLA_0D01280 [Tetrapisispora blattae CBS 6284]CCH60636.1 hypothetical protein TBLA_0D01280 [Tetrapisispora blattae CBS 6284]
MILRTKDEESCQLLGPVSISIQLGMGAIAFSGLIIKRKYEHPRRKLIVWIYDISKQIIGALIIHFVNLFISLIKRRRMDMYLVFSNILFYDNTHNKLTGGGSNNDNDNDDDDDQCDWYFLNLLLDTTIGIPILWFLLNCIHYIFQYLNIKNIESGNYFPSLEDYDTNLIMHHTIAGNNIGMLGDDNCIITASTNNILHSRRPMFKAFLIQLSIYSSGLLLMKSVVFLILNYFEEFSYWFANLMLGWSDSWPNFQVFLVMFICPIVLNCFQILCIDSIIKLPTDHLNFDSIDTFEANSFPNDVTDCENLITTTTNNPQNINNLSNDYDVTSENHNHSDESPATQYSIDKMEETLSSQYGSIE